MKIAFDFQAFAMQRYGGVSKYFVELAKHLSLKDEEVRVFAPFHQNNNLQEAENLQKSGIYFRSFPKHSGPIVRTLNRFFVSPQLKNWQPDILHETYFSSYSYLNLKVAKIVTIYDMIHELFPSSFLKRDNTIKIKKNAIDRVDRIICISESTKNDLLSFYQIPEDRITVIHLGVHLPEENKYAKPIEAPYLLYVGQRGGYKNFEGFIKAVSKSKNLKNDFNIVAFGGKPFSKSELSMIAQFGLDLNRVSQVSGNDQLLGAYYHGALAFVFPSYYEGFGLPPLEAMSFGCPVVSSNRSSMPEVIGNAGEYFDPTSLESIQSSIEKVVYSNEYRNSLIEKGNARIKLFTWQQCASKTLGVYRNAV